MLRHKSISYDPAAQEPALRVSICTGEKTAGFVDRQTGAFRDVMLIRDQKDLETFCRAVGVTELKTVY